MAAASSSLPIDPKLGRAADFVRPDFHQINLDLEGYLKTQRRFKLDSDPQICPLSLTPLGCPLPPSQCPYRHTTPCPTNFQPTPPLPSHPREREKKLTVCKHYLRNLCKMGDNCEYTHDFNLRTMPICIWYVKQGKCELGGECLYFHPRDRRVDCPDYARGFCVLGPECPRRHVRKRLCEAYASGFCPDGPLCSQSHPLPTLPDPKSYINPPIPDPEAYNGPPPQLPAGYGRWREYRYDPKAVVVPAAAWVEGGSLSGWRAGGFLSANARRQGGGGGGGGGGDDQDGGGGRKGGWQKDLSTVLCFRCNQHGHFANNCPNQYVPGDRGGGRKKDDGGF